ncbi:MAG: energy transducer TonB [Deltaproteobacteria bacterium]|nr:energy transducer TonB [Deltaproteobacteria bacterium]
MKQILPAIIISLGLHGLLFGMETNVLKKINLVVPESRQITISLLHQQQLKPAIKPSAKSKPTQFHKKQPQTKPHQDQPKPPDIIKKEISAEPETIHEPEELKPVKEYKKVSSVPPPVLPQNIASTAADLKAISSNTQTIREAKPIYRINPPPSYPIIARKRGHQGEVILEVLVDKHGKVIDLKVFSSSGYSILDKTAMASVKKWLFQPGMKGLDKIDMWVRVPIRFKLN